MRTFAISILMAGLVAAQASAQGTEDVDDLLLHMSGRFQVRGDEPKTIVHLTTPQPYRICVGSEAHDHALKVEHDKLSDTVRPGDCIDVTAALIRVSPAEALEPGYELIGRFHALP